MKQLLILFIFLSINFNILYGQGGNCTPVPVNDDPCMNGANPPYDLGYGGYHNGTTCCAVGYNDDPNADIANQECNTNTDDNTIWYRISIDPEFDGIMLNISFGNQEIPGLNYAVEVYGGGEDAICDGSAQFIRSYCFDESISESHIGCLEGMDYLFVKITSTEADCGSVFIDAQQNYSWGGADKCELITEEELLMPQTSTDGEINMVCVYGNLNMDFCPETNIENICELFGTNPTIWYKIITDSDANQLYVNVMFAGNATPVWAVFSGECGDLAAITNSEGFTCNTGSESFVAYAINPGVYYVALTVLETPVSYHEVSVCAATTKNVVECIGEETFCDNDQETEFKIINRENTEAEPEGPPYNGPFCPGEILTVQIEFTYHSDQTADDRLLAMIPDFGNAWDIDEYDLYVNSPITDDYIPAEWYDENEPCYPYAKEDFENICVYKDKYSKLHICNTLCEDCPCGEGIEKGEELPSGYFWITDDPGNDCDPSDCSPSAKRGVSGEEIKVYWTIDLKVKDTIRAGEDDLRIGFMTFSDGGAGCWDDPKAECLLDKPQFSPHWKVQYKNRIEVSPTMREICDGDTTFIKTINQESSEITRVSFKDNPDVTGEKNHIFTDSLGIINDTLSIIDPAVCDSQVVYYYVEELDKSGSCIVEQDTIMIIVWPKPIVKISKTDETLPGANDGVAKISNYCSSKIFDYRWSTGDSVRTIKNLAPGTYFLTVTNKSGCTYVDSVIINSFACSTMQTVSHSNNPACNGYCTGSITVDSVINGIPPYKYIWNTGDTTQILNNLCDGDYMVTVTDLANCSTVDTFSIVSPSMLLSNLTGTNETKKGGNDGTALVSPAGGAGGYSILWSNGQSSTMIDSLVPGKYFVTITDQNGCGIVDSIVVKAYECSVLTIISTYKDISCYGECDGSISINNVENSTSPLTYLWNTGANSASLSNLCASEYTVTITDAKNCEIEQNFTISQPEDIVISIDSFRDIRTNPLGFIAISTNDNGNYKYSWVGPNGFQAETKNIYNLQDYGCYTLTVTDTITECYQDTTICLADKTATIDAGIGNINIYPNPAKNVFLIDFRNSLFQFADITIYDLSGKQRLYFEKSGKSKIVRINSKEINAGMYIIRIQNTEVGTVYKKIIITD